MHGGGRMTSNHQLARCKCVRRVVSFVLPIWCLDLIRTGHCICSAACAGRNIYGVSVWSNLRRLSCLANRRQAIEKQLRRQSKQAHPVLYVVPYACTAKQLAISKPPSLSIYIHQIYTDDLANTYIYIYTYTFTIYIYIFSECMNICIYIYILYTYMYVYVYVPILCLYIHMFINICTHLCYILAIFLHCSVESH